MNLEIQAGLQSPLLRAEMWELLHKYLPKIHETQEAAEVLRNRIANGTRTIADARAGRLQGLSEADIVDAEARLAQLQRDLDEVNVWNVAGLGMVLGWAVGSYVGKAVQEEELSMPPGSVVRLILPGLVNIAVDLTQ